MIILSNASYPPFLVVRLRSLLIHFLQRLKMDDKLIRRVLSGIKSWNCALQKEYFLTFDIGLEKGNVDVA